MSPFIVKISGLVIVFLLFWLIRRIFAPNKSFTEFFLGDNGHYSLSRVQACVWAYIIMSYQVSVLVCLCNINFDVAAKLFTLVFSQEVLWLLGLSLGTYVTVKGIAVNQQQATPQSTTPVTVTRNWADLVSVNGQLDLSRFQMLIWTLIAVVAFMISYFHYLSDIMQSAITANTTDPTTLIAALGKYFPAWGVDDKELPTVDMSFIVLMGLSHGTYIGRKLVPDYKAPVVTAEYRQVLTNRSDALATGLKFKQNEYELIRDSPQSTTEQKVAAQQQLDALQVEQAKVAAELAQLPATPAGTATSTTTTPVTTTTTMPSQP
jgi:hypothetical protein